MDPEFRAKERARNSLLRRISRQKNFYTPEVNLVLSVITINQSTI